MGRHTLVRRWRWTALCALLALGVSCSGDVPSAEGPRRIPGLSGRILAIGFSGGENVQVYDLDTGKTAELSMPANVEVREAFWGPDGDTAYALASRFSSLGTPTAVIQARLY
ncbi:MAG TPA: hypothetical protein VE889_05685, partial [Actinomycetota bacterium]|nr:hypothetical protein [Actinomycetota bacterium]